MECHPAINAIEARRSLARLRFGVKMRTQRTLDSILSTVLPVNQPNRIVAWGSAKWAVNAKGRQASVVGKIYGYMRKHRRSQLPNGGTRLPLESEFNSSCKCSRCLGMKKMYHPTHHEVWHKRTVVDDQGNRTTQRYKAEGEVYGLYQCAARGCNATHNRDVNGFSNIWRTAWERMNRRGRPETLDKTRVEVTDEDLFQ
jgi:hypothetical protein